MVVSKTGLDQAISGVNVFIGLYLSSSVYSHNQLKAKDATIATAMLHQCPS